MPLSARARIEIYLPDVPKASYQNALKAFEREFRETFGGCTVIRDIKGLYLSADGEPETDRIVLIYADTPFEFAEHREELSVYTDHLREAAWAAAEEESILVVVHEIYHSV